MFAGKRMVRLVLLLSLSILAVPMFAQQVGEIAGRVTATDGSALPGVTVEAKAPILPQPRATVTNENGEYRLPVLPPGMYNVTFSLAGMQTVSRDLQVLLNQTATVNVSLGMQGVSEEITVTASTSLVDPESTAIKSGLGQTEIKSLPLGQD